MLIDENIVWINTNLRSIILLKIALFLYNSILSSLILQLLPYKLYAWSRCIIIALYEMSLKSDLRRITSQNTFFLHFTVFWVGLPYQCSSFLCADLRCCLVSSFQPPNCLFSFQLQSILVHGELSYLYLPPCCWDFWSLFSSSTLPILLFGFDFPVQHPSCSLSCFLLRTGLLINGGT